MKLFLLAAAATLATPALAQTTPAPQPGASTPGSATPAPPADAAQPQPDAMQTAPATPADNANPPGTTSQTTMPMAPTTGGGDPVGGYQPSGPALSGAATPGVTPVFRAAPTPDQAYPAPAPLASYPVCKKGQFDKCVQGRGSTHSREVRGRPSR